MEPEAPESSRVGEPSGWTSRTLDEESLARVRARLDALNDAVRTASDAPSRASLETVIDVARWARLDADSALAFKGHVADLRDDQWNHLRYTSRDAALAAFRAFVEATPRAWDLVAVRNLRARLEGLLSVARGLRDAV